MQVYVDFWKVLLKIFRKKWHIFITSRILLKFLYIDHSSIIETWPRLKRPRGASLVVQWLRLYLPMHGTWIPSLVWEDPTCCRVAKPVPHNYWAYMLPLLKPTPPRAQALQREQPLQQDGCAPQLESSPCLQQRQPRADINKLKHYLKKDHRER